MCGRYALTLPPDAVRVYFGYADQPNFPARYNIAPTQPVPVVTLESGSLRFVLMRWGFLPGWVRDPKDFPLVINVRSETAAEKPSFRNALKRRRCLMPADGFYEWRRAGRENQAFLFRKPDRRPFAFAAIHETWSGPDGGEIDTVALVNTQANATMAPIHHRCPIVLARGEHDAWLDPEATPGDVARLMRPPPDDLLEALRIGPAVNKVANDGPELQLPFVEPPADAALPPAPARRTRTAAKAGADQGSLF